MTETNNAFVLDRVGVLDVTGNDRVAIVHNLTTNEIKSLAPYHGCETFVTDVRGKAIAHVMLYLLPDRIRLIGPHGFSQRIAQHAERYIIREDAIPSVRDDEFAGIVLSPQATGVMLDEPAKAKALVSCELPIGPGEILAYPCRWLGEGSCMLLIETDNVGTIVDALSTRGLDVGSELQFHASRTEIGFPWYGVDLDESNLPQEADRDALTISFTKGCYLGQETIARLDALGQVQKKLVRWKVSGQVGRVVPGVTLDCDGKTVGRLTSVTPAQNDTISAIGFARRSHFEAGSEAKGTDEVSGDVYRAVVIA